MLKTIVICFQTSTAVPQINRALKHIVHNGVHFSPNDCVREKKLCIWRVNNPEETLPPEKVTVWSQ